MPLEAKGICQVSWKSPFYNHVIHIILVPMKGIVKRLHGQIGPRMQVRVLHPLRISVSEGVSLQGALDRWCFDRGASSLVLLTPCSGKLESIAQRSTLDPGSPCGWGHDASSVGAKARRIGSAEVCQGPLGCPAQHAKVRAEAVKQGCNTSEVTC